MLKNLILSILILIVGQSVFALDIVYPKKNDVVINSSASFFVGSANPDEQLTINGLNVEVHPSGGFVFPVKLVYGVNNFKVKSGSEVVSYNITRKNIPQLYSCPAKLVIYPVKQSGRVINENAVLRSTPQDSGINRIAMLPSDTDLIVDGEQGGFYRVILGESKKGWIFKRDVSLSDYSEPTAELLGKEFFENKDYYIYTFKLSNRVPWEIEEKNGLKISIFNLKNIDFSTYTLHIDKQKMLSGHPLNGYSAEYIGNDLVFKVRKPVKINHKYPLKGLTIVIDAGHGGKEIGTTGCLGDKEKDVNLEYAFELEKILKSRGANVVMTRNDDTEVSLSERVNITKKEDAVVFISLHGNALPDSVDPTNVHGTEIYYYYNQAKPLAHFIMNEIVKIPETANRGIIQQSFAVVRNTSALSLLIEVGYMINPADNALIISEEFRRNIVRAIADGIENYFSCLNNCKS